MHRPQVSQREPVAGKVDAGVVGLRQCGHEAMGGGVWPPADNVDNVDHAGTRVKPLPNGYRHCHGFLMAIAGARIAHADGLH